MSFSAFCRDGHASLLCTRCHFPPPCHSYRSIEDEYTTPNAECLDETLYKLSTPPAPEHAPLKWYIMMRAADAFFEKHGRWPGDTDATVS